MSLLLCVGGAVPPVLSPAMGVTLLTAHSPGLGEFSEGAPDAAQAGIDAELLHQLGEEFVGWEARPRRAVVVDLPAETAANDINPAADDNAAESGERREPDWGLGHRFKAPGDAGRCRGLLPSGCSR